MVYLNADPPPEGISLLPLSFRENAKGKDMEDA